MAIQLLSSSIPSPPHRCNGYHLYVQTVFVTLFLVDKGILFLLLLCPDRNGAAALSGTF